MKKEKQERRSGRDRRAQARYCFGAVCRDRRRTVPANEKKFDERSADYWPQAV